MRYGRLTCRILRQVLLPAVGWRRHRKGYNLVAALHRLRVAALRNSLEIFNHFRSFGCFLLSSGSSWASKKDASQVRDFRSGSTVSRVGVGWVVAKRMSCGYSCFFVSRQIIQSFVSTVCFFLRFLILLSFSIQLFSQPLRCLVLLLWKKEMKNFYYYR